MARSAAVGAVVVGSLNTLFIGVDYLVFPDRFSDLLPLRLMCNAAMLVAYFWGAKRYPLVSAGSMPYSLATASSVSPISG